MCGILGITGAQKTLISTAAQRMKHRGPDSYGVYEDDVVTLGHNRLSIIDLSERANQPLFDSSGELGIVFNGEIYNYRSLKKELQEQYGVLFATDSDTEVLLGAYRIWGSGLVGRLKGMYAFAIYDKKKQELFLCTDQSAMKPLYFCATDSVFAFASELAPLLMAVRGMGHEPKLHTRAIDMFLSSGQMLAPETLYEGVYRLPPRTSLVYDLQSHTYTKSCYDTETKDTRPLDEVLSEEVEQHLVADVPVGLFFSGGTDSSLIASYLKELQSPLQAFCVELYERPEDARYAREIAEKLSVPLSVFPFGPKEFDEVYAEVTAKLDEPLADSSLFPTYFVAKKAREQVKVVLSGEGGDEYFFGYPRSRYLYALREVKKDRDVSLLERLFFLLPFFSGKNKLFEYLYIFARRPLAYYLLTMSPTKSLMTLSMWRDTKRALYEHTTTVARFDADTYLPNILLRKTDIATMYASLEGRLPLLAVSVEKAAARVAKSTVLRKELKPALKQLLLKFLPPQLVYRKKTGFGLRTRSLFVESSRLREDLYKAVAFLKKEDLLSISIPPEDRLLQSYPSLVWGIISLYHAIRNTRT